MKRILFAFGWFAGVVVIQQAHRFGVISGDWAPVLYCSWSTATFVASGLADKFFSCSWP